MKRIAITPGDPAGIGPEIVLKTLIQNPGLYQSAQLSVVTNPEILQHYAYLFQLKARFKTIADLDSIPSFTANTIYCFPNQPFTNMPPTGTISSYAGQIAFNSITSAIKAALDKKVDAVVTGPINKQALKKANIPFMDHTAMFTKLSNSSNTQTLFVTGNLRIFFLTRHMPLAAVSAALNKEMVVRGLQSCQKHLRQICIENPRLVLAALNPHGGEHGLFGNEEDRVLAPAVAEGRTRGIDCYGPVPADSVFHLAHEGAYDAVLSLYHDQGHIAAKTLDFYGTVSLTMGLPFLRTSVDHGTALEIAGQNIANERSMVEAIKAAIHYSW